MICTEAEGMEIDGVSVVTEDFVKVLVTISSNQLYNAERSFPKSLTICELKGKLELMTGGNSATMQLSVFNKAGNPVCNMSSDDALLGSYPIDSGMVIHVVDNFAIRSEFDVNTSDVPKFELSQEKYAQRTDTVKAHLERNKLGKYDPEREEQLRKEKEALQVLETELAAKMKVGDRCEVSTPQQPTRRGTIMFVGSVHFQTGLWAGVKLDEPVGKNDGSVGGQRYFECTPKYGSFVKVTNIKVGDFPEQDPFAEDEM